MVRIGNVATPLFEFKGNRILNFTIIRRSVAVRNVISFKLTTHFIEAHTNSVPIVAITLTAELVVTNSMIPNTFGIQYILPGAQWFGTKDISAQHGNNHITVLINNRTCGNIFERIARMTTIEENKFIGFVFVSTSNSYTWFLLSIFSLNTGIPHLWSTSWLGKVGWVYFKLCTNFWIFTISILHGKNYFLNIRLFNFYFISASRNVGTIKLRYSPAISIHWPIISIWIVICSPTHATKFKISLRIKQIRTERIISPIIILPRYTCGIHTVISAWSSWSDKASFGVLIVDVDSTLQ